jgi:1-pyrroline-5-carboxylate dehydrogenase
MYGDIFFKIAAEMRKPEIQDYFTKLIQRVMPKSTAQIIG